MPKCVYLVRGQPCGVRGEGNPILCDEHAPDEDDFGADAVIQTAVDALLDSRPLQKLFGRTNQFLDQVAGHLSAGLRRPEVPLHTKPRKTRQTRTQRPQKPDGQHDARLIMGFDVAEKLTENVIKKRKRQLAAALHPDRGGNTFAMAKLNTAADLLLKMYG